MNQNDMKAHIISIVAMLLAGILSAGAQSSAVALELAQKAVADAKAATAPDKRQNICDIKVYNDGEGNLTVGGRVSEQFIRDAITGNLAASGVDYIDRIEVIAPSWAQTCIPAASHRTAASHAAEMSTQSVMGTPLRVLGGEGEFRQVQTPDGYIAWVPTSSIAEKTAGEMAMWRRLRRFVVMSPYQILVYRTPAGVGPREVVSDLVNGSIVTVVGDSPLLSSGRLHVELPDGRSGYAEARAFVPIEEWAGQDFNPDRILDVAYSMEGTPYLWGGTSTKALDCSGLVKVSYLANGIILMRDASQQACTGRRIEPQQWRSCRAGDLLFFGNKKTGKVTHVAIYDHDGNYVHSSGRVKRNSIDPDSPFYLTTPFLLAVRIDGSEDTPGITRVRNHPWYFDN